MSENPEFVPPEDRGGRSIRDVLVADRWRLLGVGLIGAGAVMVLGVDLEIPRWVRLFALTLGIGILVGYFPAARIVEWLYHPDYRYLVDLDARESEFAVWRLPPEDWRELTVEDGDLYELRAMAPAWTCRDYDPEENIATGTWRGSASDLELVEDRERIAEVRGELEDLAREGLALRAKQSGIVRTAVREVVNAFVSDFEGQTLYEGEAVQDAVADALDVVEVEEEPEAPGDVEPGDDGTMSEANDLAGADGAAGGAASDD